MYSNTGSLKVNCKSFPIQNVSRTCIKSLWLQSHGYFKFLRAWTQFSPLKNQMPLHNSVYSSVHNHHLQVGCASWISWPYNTYPNTQLWGSFMHMKATYQIKKLPSMGWIANRRSGLWCQSRSKHSIFASRESGAWPMVGPESVASELIDVVALKGITQRSYKFNN
jgi:hypothetical protein